MALQPVPIILHNSPTDANVPTMLYRGELAVNVGPNYTKLWAGEGPPTNISRLLLSNNDADNPLFKITPGIAEPTAAGNWLRTNVNTWVQGALASAGVPTGGTQYQALIKGVGTAFGWNYLGLRSTNNIVLVDATGWGSGFGSGSNSVAIGSAAAFYADSFAVNNSVAIGAFSGMGGGTNNVTVGSGAGSDGNHTNAVYLGYNARPSTITGISRSNEIVIGADATGHGDNTVTLGNASTTQLWLGDKQLVFGPADSAGAGFRTVSIAN